MEGQVFLRKSVNFPQFQFGSSNAIRVRPQHQIFKMSSTEINDTEIMRDREKKIVQSERKKAKKEASTISRNLKIASRNQFFLHDNSR